MQRNEIEVLKQSLATSVSLLGAEIKRLGERLDMAIAFEHPSPRNPRRRVRINKRGPDIWTICNGLCQLWRRDGGWIYDEPQPSPRNDESLERTRFTREEAFVAAEDAQDDLDAVEST